MKLSKEAMEFAKDLGGMTEIKAIKAAIFATEKFAKEILAPTFKAGGVANNEIASYITATFMTVVQTNPPSEFNIDDEDEEKDEAEEIEELLDKLSKKLKEK